MKLWIDDERPVPDDSWQFAFNIRDAQFLLESFREDLEHVSFDYVLGHGEYGDELLRWMIAQDIKPVKVTVHSSGSAANELMIKIAANAGIEATVFS